MILLMVLYSKVLTRDRMRRSALNKIKGSRGILLRLVDGLEGWVVAIVVGNSCICKYPDKNRRCDWISGSNDCCIFRVAIWPERRLLRGWLLLEQKVLLHWWTRQFFRCTNTNKGLECKEFIYWKDSMYLGFIMYLVIAVLFAVTSAYLVIRISPSVSYPQ